MGVFMHIIKRILIYSLTFTTYYTQTHYTEPVSLIQEIATTDELYGAIQATKPTIIKLYSEHCPYCSIFSKTFEDFAKKNKRIRFFSLNGKKLNAPKVVSDFTNNSIKIPGYPSVLFIKNGSIVDFQIGGNPKVFEEKIQKNLK